MPRSIRCFAALLVLFLYFTPLSVNGQNELIDELASQLPTVSGKSPQESMATIKLRAGFQVELVASEPHLRDPAAIAFDEQGWIYVAELPQYNSYVEESFQQKGAVRLLKDTDDDGTIDESIIFLDGLEYPTALACWDGGVFIGVAPDLLYAKDTDGDGRADEKKVVLTGFGTDKAGEAHLNSMRWGPDNRIHFSTSLSGGEIRPGDKPEAAGVSVRGRGMILDPRNPQAFELTSGGGQHGMSMDDWGRKYVCSNSVPAQTLMYDDRYLTRNPFVEVPAAAVDIAPDGKFTQLYRISPHEPWRVLRTRLRKEGKFRGSDEGGKPFGFFTGATGITVYRGDAWPQEYRGNLLIGDVANNLVYRARVEPEGVKLIAHRADPGQEFIASTDIWFRPVQFENAPDGALYVLDFYRGLIEGAAFLPPEFLKYLDTMAGNDQGRIYRIAPTGFQRRATPKLGARSTVELVSLLDHPNGWHRDTASRLLYQRQDSSAMGPLRELAGGGKTAMGRSMALYSLRGLNGLQEEELLTALEDQSPLVRAHAIRLAEGLVASSAALAARLPELVHDKDPRVRYQLAFSLGEVEDPARTRALTLLAAQDGTEPWMRVAIGSSVGRGGGTLLADLLKNVQYRQAKHGQDLLLALAQQIGARNKSSEVAQALQATLALPVALDGFRDQLLTKVLQKRTDKASAGQVRDILNRLVAEARKVANDSSANLDTRVDAIHRLRLSSFDAERLLYRDLLSLKQPDRIQSVALQSLTSFSDPAVADLVLESWPTLSPKQRTRATETLLSRPAWIGRFLDAIEAETVRRGDLDLARMNLLKGHPDPKIAERVAELYAGQRESPRQEVVARYQPALTMNGSAERGRQVFRKVCAACHKLENVGNAIGADLKAIRDRGMASVLLNVLDPNREVKPQYQSFVLSTEDGRIVTGMIESETANSLVIRRPDGTQVTVPRREIETLQTTGVSFMPEGLDKQIDVQAMADLLAYLNEVR